MRRLKIGTYKSRVAIRNTIQTHEKYKNSYFFKPQGMATTRKAKEDDFLKKNPPFTLYDEKTEITVKPSYAESAQNVYYSLSILKNGKKSDIRALKALLK